MEGAEKEPRKNIEHRTLDLNVLKVYGKITGEMLFSHKQVNQDLLVGDIPGEVILGMDLLRKNVSWICQKDFCICMGKELSVGMKIMHTFVWCVRR